MCDIHGMTQESDDYEFVLYRAARCCQKYAVTDGKSWEARIERDRLMAELKVKQKEAFKSGKDQIE